MYDNLYDLTIKSDTGQHSQFLICFDYFHIFVWEYESKASSVGNISTFEKSDKVGAGVKFVFVFPTKRQKNVKRQTE